jgi:hypothetical protein
MEKIKKNYIEKNCWNLPCFQEKNYKAKFSTSLKFKKIKSIKIILKKNITKKTKKNTMQENTVAIYSVS